MDLYDKIAKDYDFLNPKKEIFKQKAFFRQLIKKYSIRTCLDCVCGTGWHLFMLDELGIKCHGSDSSPAMLTLAKKNLKGRNIPLKKEDYRNLSHSWKKKFDMIICMTTSLHHMLTKLDVMTALRSMYQQLNEGGILIISHGITDSLLNSKPKFMPARILKEHAFYFFLEYPNPKRIIFNVLHTKKTKRSFDHDFYIFPYHALRPSTFKKWMAQAKFRKVYYFGDFAFSKYSAKKSQHIIVVAQK